MPTPILSNLATATWPSTELQEVQRQQRATLARRTLWLLAAVCTAVVISIAVANPWAGAVAVAGVAFLAVLVVWLWQQPVRGVYVLFGASALLAAYDETGLTDYIGVFLPFFRDIKSWSNTGLIVSPAELFMALVFGIWILKGIVDRNLAFDRGSMLLPLGLYMAMVLFGEFRGVTTGGDLHDSLWELRSQMYMLVAYVLVCNLVKKPEQVTRLLWVLILCAAARGIEGTLQYIFVLRAQDLSTHELYPHEQSYFFNGFITLAIVAFAYKSHPRMRRVMLYFLPFVIVADMANNRRASIAALVISMVALVLIVWLTRPRARRGLTWALLILAVVYPPYFLHYQNRTGFLALPARAISSSFHPTANDQASNQYRVFEDLDIMSTVRTSPVIGVGFGKPMLSPYYLPNIGYVFQYIMPHNSILWVWMRLGTVGYLLLWLMIGLAIIQATHLARWLRDPWLQGLAVFVLLMLIQQVIISYVDLQWSNYRTMIATGVLFALMSRLSIFAAREVGSTGESLPLTGAARAAEAVVRLPSPSRT